MNKARRRVTGEIDRKIIRLLVVMDYFFNRIIFLLLCHPVCLEGFRYLPVFRGVAFTLKTCMEICERDYEERHTGYRTGSPLLIHFFRPSGGMEKSMPPLLIRILFIFAWIIRKNYKWINRRNNHYGAFWRR